MGTTTIIMGTGKSNERGDSGLSDASTIDSNTCRALGSFEQDPRLRLMQAKWFKGRHVLDVGCNEGLVTLAVAAGFGCKRTTGVDIDETLIKRARRCEGSMHEARF